MLEDALKREKALADRLMKEVSCATPGMKIRSLGMGRGLGRGRGRGPLGVPVLKKIKGYL